MPPRRRVPLRGARHHEVGRGHDAVLAAPPVRAAAAAQVQAQLLGLRERIFKERKFLRAADDWPWGIPDEVREAGDAPAGGTPQIPGDAVNGVPVKLLAADPQARWEEANVIRGVARGTVSAIAYARL